MKSILISIKPKWVAKILNGEKTIEYKKLRKTYFNMHSRCENPKASRYERYGGRGIKVCDEWSGKDGLNNFVLWALNSGYFHGSSIERIDVEKGYSPDNCKWIPLNEQSINTRRTHWITHGGRTMCLEHWCNELKIPSNTILYRVKNEGYTFENALFNYHPKQKGYKTHCPHGHEYTEENSMINSQGYRICKTCYLESREKIQCEKEREKKMPKAILMSIKPKYVAEILNHRKTIEIRKTCPKCDLPVDVYIYCTEPYAKEVLSLFVPHIRPILGGRAGEFIERRIVDNPSMRWSICNGKVVAKFKLRFVEKIYPCGTDDLDTELGSSLEELSFESCVPEKDLLSYVGNEAFCWIISCLEIFDEPKELDEFGLKRAPESFCYIEKAPQ